MLYQNVVGTFDVIRFWAGFLLIAASLPAQNICADAIAEYGTYERTGTARSTIENTPAKKSLSRSVMGQITTREPLLNALQR
jgi:hypothetical protein